MSSSIDMAKTANQEQGMSDDNKKDDKAKRARTVEPEHGHKRDAVDSDSGIGLSDDDDDDNRRKIKRIQSSINHISDKNRVNAMWDTLEDLEKRLSWKPSLGRD